MKLMIHCDEVFDILTRGPFPSGHESDPAVEHHLRCCHDCRQLAEALRPAVELFHESLSAVDSAQLPAYQGEVTPLTQPFTRRLPQTIAEVQLPPEIAPRHDHDLAKRWAILMQAFVATALTVVAVMLVINFGNSLRELQPADRGGQFQAVAPSATAPASHEEAARQLLALRLPAACWLDQKFPLFKDGSSAKNQIEQQIALALEKHELACCTRCHAESNAKSNEESKIPPQLQQFATLQQSCLICHKG